MGNVQQTLFEVLRPTIIATGNPGALEDSFADWKRVGPKSLGQVATPPEIAFVMAKWVAAGSPETVLDPAVGHGNLLNAVRSRCPQATLVGIERDEETWRAASVVAPEGTTLFNADYMLSDLDDRLDGIIANPPYVKVHHLQYSSEEWRDFSARLGVTIHGSTNLYALFLLKIFEDLKDDGRAAVLIPAEFLNANFGVFVKRRLIEWIAPRGIIVFDPQSSLFEKAITTSCILFLHKTEDRLERPLWLSRAGSVADAASFETALRVNERPAGAIDTRNWNVDDKWLNAILHAPESVDLDFLSKRVRDYFRCSRGIATGANSFFTLRPSELQHAGLSQDDVDACLTKASHVDKIVIDHEDFRRLTSDDQRCFLLNPKAPSPELSKYLERGISEGVAQKYLTRTRRVWYLPEDRRPADVLVPVFSRGHVLFSLNRTGAKNLTCFHGLYPKRELNSAQVAFAVAYFNSQFGQAAFREVNRFYGDGLNKVEPRDVEAMRFPELPRLDEKEDIRIVRQLRSMEDCSPRERMIGCADIIARFL